MKLRLFTPEAYDRLLNSVDKNADRYLSGEDWVGDFFKNDDSYFVDSGIEVSDFEFEYVPGIKTKKQKSHEDFTNACRLYKAFKNLTRKEATIRYMWSYLAHCVPQFRDYARDRWLRKPDLDTIRERFFVNEYSGLLNGNAISRLWWCACLTHLPNEKDEFRLTRILLTNQVICSRIMDSQDRMNINRLKGVLTALEDIINEYPGTSFISLCFNHCYQRMNREAACLVMESLTPEEIRDKAYRFMSEFMREHESGS